MVLGFQIRAARTLLGWSVVELAKSAGVAKAVIVRLEADKDSDPAAAQAVQQALEAAGIRFIEYADHAGVASQHLTAIVRRPRVKPKAPPV